MGRIMEKRVKSILIGFGVAFMGLVFFVVLMVGCENPVQGYIATELYGPKYNLEVKKFVEESAVNYGFALDIYGDYIVIGAPADHSNTTEEESVYIYHRVAPHKWGKAFVLPKPVGYTLGDRFGYSVSIYGSESGYFVAVGAPDTSVNGKPNAGAVYIYKRKDNTLNEWEEVKKFTKEDQNPTLYSVTGNEQFGKSVKLYNNWLLVGAPYDGLNGPDSNYGAVYRFRYNGNEWGYDYIFSRSPVLAGANFGMAVDVNSSYAVIGAPGEDIDGKSNVGSVYIYSFNNNKFEFKERITNLDEYTGDDDYFGGSLSISGKFLAVGVAGSIVNGIFMAGKVEMFMLENGSWNNAPTVLQLEEPSEYDFFGFPSVVREVSDDTYVVMVGCFDRDKGDTADVGSVYIYTNTTGPNWTNSWTLQKELRASDSSESAYFGKSIALGDDYAIVGACSPRDDTVFENGGVYVFR